MNSSIPSKAVDGALRLARFPTDQLLRVAPETGTTTSVGLAIDRADAAVRSAAGSVLSDQGLRDDGERRRAAAEERKRAMRLRTKAHERVETAEARPTRSRPSPWLDASRPTSRPSRSGRRPPGRANG